jgi:Holliday junction resolvase RusA-like endonuclease
VDVLSLIIKGKPISQKRHRHTKKGFTYDPSKPEKKEFISKIEKKPKKPFKGYIHLQVYFYIPYPKKYYRTGKYSDQLKDGAPYYCIARPDVDNYLKFVMDCLNGIMYEDDSQVVNVEATKMYSTEPQTIIIIKEMKNGI